jgi:hypothetical protein
LKSGKAGLVTSRDHELPSEGEKSNMRLRKGLFSSALLIMPAISLFLQSLTAQIPGVPSPTKAGCFDTRNNLVRCGERFVAESQGTIYDCVCNCSGNNQCTPGSQSGNTQAGESSDIGGSENSAAVDEEAARARKAEETLEKERRENFERNHEALVISLKGSGTSKTGTTSLNLKGLGNASNLSLKSSTAAAPLAAVTPEMRSELMTGVLVTIQVRGSSPSREGAEILQSLKTDKPPNLDQDPYASLMAGDVILIDRIPFSERDKYGWKDMALSQGVNFADRLASSNYTSRASHVALFLGERNSKRWFLNNTTEHGPVIIQESEFLRLYGGRDMDVARLVGKPISKEEGDQIWKAAHEQRETNKYGIWSKNRMVCSESARWALMSTGRDIPEQNAGDIQFLGTQSGVNKKEFVNFSPADFYASWKYFIIRPLTR